MSKALLVAVVSLTAACIPKVRADPQCATREREILSRIRSPGSADVQVTGEWGNPKGGFTWVMKQRGASVSIDVGHLVTDSSGRSRYRVEGTMEGVVDGSTLYYHERSRDPGAGSFGTMTVTSGRMSGPRWAKGGGACYLNPSFEQVRLQ